MAWRCPSCGQRDCEAGAEFAKPFCNLNTGAAGTTGLILVILGPLRWIHRGGGHGHIEEDDHGREGGGA